MKKTKENAVSLEKKYVSSAADIINLFKNNTVFKLTGADEIESKFITGKSFSLVFKNRGKIYGHFMKITKDEIILEWNVHGFQMPSETGTAVEINLRQENEFCILKLKHKNIPLVKSVEMKKIAWMEILDDMEKFLDATFSTEGRI